MKYTTDHYIKSYHINRFGKLSTSFLFYHMQEIANEHANVLGFGYDQLKESKLFWVLSRLWVKIYRRPSWKEKFSLSTWSRGTDGFYGYRDFQFFDENGECIIEATSSWLAINLETKRIQRLSMLENVPAYNESVFGENPSKLMAPECDEKLKFSPVLFNEIDINQHFNSGRYLERILDSYDFSFHEKNELIEFEVNFLKEGMPNDQLSVKKEVKEDLTHLCSVVRESDLIDLIKAKMIWKERG